MSSDIAPGQGMAVAKDLGVNGLGFPEDLQKTLSYISVCDLL